MITFSKLGSYGRKGNQLFQMAATIGHAKRQNTDFIFPAKCSFWGKYTNLEPRYFGSIVGKQHYQEPFFYYSDIIKSSDLDLHGYFQSYKYWKNCEDEIRRLLTPNRHQEQLLDTTAIHVRRTDYLDHKDCYEILGMDYYERAMERTNTSKYILFSDDISWCKKHFIGNQFEFSEGNSDIVDLSIMTKCTNNIVANSSFSWWGAWLNSNPDKKVIAPVKWFGPKLSPTHNTKDLLPEEWIKID